MIESEPRGGTECTARERVYELESSMQCTSAEIVLLKGLLVDVQCNYHMIINAVEGRSEPTPTRVNLVTDEEDIRPDFVPPP